MRLLMPTFIVAALLLAAPVALAAPTCLNQNGDTMKCGTPGAMPVGWTLSPQQLLDREMSQPAEPNTTEMLEAICTLVLLLSLIALMPEFDGSHGTDWDKQEGDDEERG